MGTLRCMDGIGQIGKKALRLRFFPFFVTATNLKSINRIGPRDLFGPFLLLCAVWYSILLCELAIQARTLTHNVSFSASVCVILMRLFVNILF